MIQRYRKKPVVIEAMRYLHGITTKEEILAFCPTANVGATEAGEIHWFSIPTLEGDMHVGPGDYIIKGVADEFYPCKADIFRKTYEEA